MGAFDVVGGGIGHFGKIPVKVDAVHVCSPGVGYRRVPVGCVLAVEVGAIRIGKGIDPDLQLVDEPVDLGIAAVAAEDEIDQSEREHIAHQLVAMHGGGIEKSRFILFGVGIVGDFDRQQQAALDAGAEGVDPADLRIAVGKMVHHAVVLRVGGVLREGERFSEVGGHV